MLKLKNIDYQILTELMANSKISDQKLSKKFGTSQPTISRRRAKLEKNGMLSYTAIPKFEELGFEILAFSFLKYNLKVRELLESNQLTDKMNETVKQNPSVIFASSGQGLASQGISVSIHQNFADYIEHIKKTKEAWGEWVSSINSFTVSLTGDNIVKPFTFQQLIELVKKP